MKWKELPAGIRNPGRPRTEVSPAYLREAEQLRACPGRWAVLNEFPLSVPRATPAGFAHNISTGRYAAFRPVGDFEVKLYTNTTAGVYEIYIRFNPPKDRP